MNKTELKNLHLEIGQKIDVLSKEHNAINVVFDGIKEYNEYGVSDVYVLYHRVEAAKLEDIRKIDVVNNTHTNTTDTTDNTNATMESPTEEQNKEQKATNTAKTYECSCGKIYSHYASWYQHAKKTGHAKKA